MMDISDFATDNGPFQPEEGQIPPSASTAGMVQKPLTNTTQSTAPRPIMSSQYQSVAALASQYPPDNVLPAIAMTQVREPVLVSTFDRDKLWTLCSDYDRFKRDGGRAPIDRFLTPQVAKALRGMIGTLDPTRANAPLKEIDRERLCSCSSESLRNHTLRMGYYHQPLDRDQTRPITCAEWSGNS
jgi:hypothetical protein